ncbi:MAG TPA: gluconokinase [Vicinamibacterales bacterium]|nr:gluconokinase [Vicinamibacterales bacterium]
MRVLTLDIGTSSVRATIYGEKLRPIRPPAQVKYSWHIRGDGSVELPAARLERILQTAIDTALAGIRGDVELVATAAFWHSLVGVDSAGRAITPVIPWSDTRASAEATELRERLDESAVHARTGCRLHPTYWPARLRWFRTRDPRTFQRVHRWMSFPAYLQHRWVGSHAESLSQASGTGMFVAFTGWDVELCRACEVEPRQLGELVDLDANDAGLGAGGARRWPALKRARWLPALGDGAANNLGAGCVDGMRAALMIGTSGALRVAWPSQSVPEVPSSLWRYWIDRRRVIVGGALSNGGNLVAWLRDTLDIAIDRKLDARLARIPPDAHGLTVLPFLAGDRSPDYRPDAHAVFAGLRLATTRYDIVRAALEAVAYRFLAVFGALDGVRLVPHVVATGTALRASAVWVQILSDVLGRPIGVPAEDEVTSRGAAIAGFERSGLTDAPPPRIARTFTPDRRAHAVYRAAAERQQAMIDSLDPLHS